MSAYIDVVVAVGVCVCVVAVRVCAGVAAGVVAYAC